MSFLNNQDIATLREMARAYRSTPAAVQGRPMRQDFRPDPQMAPEVYVAKPQSAGGIVARGGTTPGSGVCDLYQIRDDGDLSAVSDMTKVVYNISTIALDQDYFLVKRDKFGRWIASTPSEGTVSPPPVFCSAKFIGVASATDMNFTVFNRLPETGGTFETLNSGEFSIVSNRLRFANTGIYTFHAVINFFLRFPQPTAGSAIVNGYQVSLKSGSGQIETVFDQLSISSPPHLWDGSAHVDGSAAYAWQAGETRATNGFMIIENADDEIQFDTDPAMPSGGGTSMNGHFHCQWLKDIEYD